jgi:nitroreductase
VETLAAIASRRNVRAFADRPVSEEQLRRILDAGRLAPSGRNWQPWDFVVVTDRAQLQELAGVWVGARHVATSAATIAVIAPGDPEELQRARFDLGQAVMSIMLAAADLGVASGHAGCRDQDLARRVLGFPADRACAMLVALGYPVGRPLAAVRHDRRPFNQVVHWGTW